jgi:hypothetical protein
MTQLVTHNTKTFLNVAYIRQRSEYMRQLKSLFEQHERYSLFSRRPDGSHSALTGWVWTCKDSFYERKTKITLIFSIIELISVSEQQYSTPMSPSAHRSSTVSTATFNPHKKVSKTHFNIIPTFLSKLWVSNTYNFLPHVKCQPRFRSMQYYPAIRTGTAVSDVANVAVFQFRRISVGLWVK